jgi:steroid 5-alpha reductase family enzyme
VLEKVLHTGLIPASIAVFLYMSTVFIIALIKRDNGIVDITWGHG